MNRKFKLFIGLIVCLASSVSCNKYLDIQPKGVTLLTTVTDYDQWLNSASIEASVPREINLLQDNEDEPLIPSTITAVGDLIYTWAPQFSTDITQTPVIWAQHYQNIYYFNTVISGIDAATGSAQLKASLKAEALLGRALEYLYLVNLYGKAYDPATANNDLAVPFVVSNDLAVTIPPRSTVQAIYNDIFADVNAALPALPQDNSNNRFRGSVAGGYSVLARAYLFMRNYAQASVYAQKALLAGPHSLLDYSNMANSAAIPLLTARPDAIYARMTAGGLATAETPTVGFLQSFDINDLRLQFFYSGPGAANNKNATRNTTAYKPGGTTAPSEAYQNWGTSVAEMQLIIAEAAARTGDLTTALQFLNGLRKCRFAASKYQAYQSTDQSQVLQRILLERSFEFAFIGMRWFDMRRLAADQNMPTVNRYDGQNNVIATLQPSSPRYTLQIPAQVMYFHPDWVQNP
jgi:hypothetical protein